MLLIINVTRLLLCSLCGISENASFFLFLKQIMSNLGGSGVSGFRL